MIKIVQGDLLKSKADALVNPVNTQGIMGKGLALEFKKTFPYVFKKYEDVCVKGEMMIGRVQTVTISVETPPFYIINFPTKQEWYKPSSLGYIKRGLQSLIDEVQLLGLRSIAMPALGCGLGGLSFKEVEVCIRDSFAGVSNVDISIYNP